jgi:uncharacterized protein DUF4145
MSQNKIVPPAIDKPAFNCPACGAFAHQDWVDLGFETNDGLNDSYFEPLGKGLPRSQQMSAGFEEAAESLPWAKRSTWQATLCASCDGWAIWYGRTMVYPPPRLGGAPHPDMPDDVRQLFEEASAVAAVSSRAGAAFARVTVERLLKTLFPDVQPKLEYLIAEAKRRGVSPAVGQMLDVMRVTGNGAVHVDDNPGDLVVLVLDEVQGPELVSKLLQAINDLVQQLITMPREAAELKARIPASIQARIDQLSPPAEQA